MKHRHKLPYLTVLALASLMLFSACSKKEENTEQQTSQPAQTTATAAPIDPATVASVSGTVKFTGTAPKPVKIDMSQDPGCKGTNTSEVIVVDGGNLANAFVYVKDGLGDRTFQPPATEVELDQEGCQYHPHVLGLMTGQTLEIKNEDTTTHNVHPTPRENREWNESQPAKAPDIKKQFAREEIMMPVKCNQHPWMKMYISVVKHPFFAVTDKSGKFELKGLPPGEYTIAVVHEKLGEQTQKITVAAKDSKTVDFSYPAPGGAGD